MLKKHHVLLAYYLLIMSCLDVRAFERLLTYVTFHSVVVLTGTYHDPVILRCLSLI